MIFTGRLRESVPALAALAAPFVFALPQRRLIPSWYAASLYVANGLLLVCGIAAVLAIARIARRAAWRWPARLAACAALALVLVAAAVTTWNGATREGLFVCGRELADVVECPGGGQAFEFTSVCVAGNPRNEVALRPNALPFMYAVPQESAAAACAARRR